MLDSYYNRMCLSPRLMMVNWNHALNDKRIEQLIYTIHFEYFLKDYWRKVRMSLPKNSVHMGEQTQASDGRVSAPYPPFSCCKGNVVHRHFQATVKKPIVMNI